MTTNKKLVPHRGWCRGCFRTLGIAMSVGLFILLPTALTGLIGLVWTTMPLWVRSVLEGVLKVATPDKGQPGRPRPGLDRLLLHHQLAVRLAHHHRPLAGALHEDALQQGLSAAGGLEWGAVSGRRLHGRGGAHRH